MTREERWAFVEDLLENTQKYKDKWTSRRGSRRRR